MHPILQYKEKTGLSYYSLGHQFGFYNINPATNIRRYCLLDNDPKNWRFPKWDAILRIEKATGKQVTREKLIDAWIKRHEEVNQKA
jgi:hypothetical protein